MEEKRFDSAGEVEYEHVRPGDHELFISYPDSGWSRLHLRLDSGDDWLFNFKIAGSRALNVRAIDEKGTPIPPLMTIVLTAMEENGVRVVRLRQPWQDGRVRFEGLRADRAQVFVLAEDNEILTTRDVDLASDEQELEIRLGDAPFRVHVVDRDGAAVPGAWLSIRTKQGEGFVGVADTDVEGWASFKGLPPGELLLNVGHQILGTRYGIPIEASAKELELVLEASGSLQLVLADGTEPLAGVATRIETSAGVTLADARETDGAGVVRYELLGEGQYRLSCRRADCWPTFVEEQLDAGEHATVPVQMRRLADLELTVLTRDGLPVSDLEVELRSGEFDTSVASWLADGLVESSGGLTTDVHGQVRIERLPRGPYEWSVELGGEAQSGTVALTPAEPNAVRILFP
jgi:hypothetical protein